MCFHEADTFSIMHRLRFAPSPTGYLHVGGARTALFNWLFVKKIRRPIPAARRGHRQGAEHRREHARDLRGLEWLGLNWDEEVVYQGAELPRHQADAQRLLERVRRIAASARRRSSTQQRKAAEARGEDSFKYDRRCDRLAPDEVARRVDAGMPFVVRFRMPEGETSWDDLVHGRITFPNKDIGEGISSFSARTARRSTISPSCPTTSRCASRS